MGKVVIFLKCFADDCAKQWRKAVKVKEISYIMLLDNSLKSCVIQLHKFCEIMKFAFGYTPANCCNSAAVIRGSSR